VSVPLGSALTFRIYPIASAGGYQLLGRTLSTWQAWAENHSIVDNFDQIEFYPVSEDDLVKVSEAIRGWEEIDVTLQTERAYKAGSW
jgi:allophanate hydrolase subunit 1